MYFRGILLTKMSDEGPVTLFNFSHLDEIATMKIAISLMTALGLGDSQEQLNQLHGSFPVPGRQELALAYPFKVFAPNSADPRIKSYGRDATIFLLFSRENKSMIFKHYELIERTIQRAISPVKEESNLSETLIKFIYSKIEKVIATSEGEKIEPSAQQISDNLQKMEKERRTDQIVKKAIDKLNDSQNRLKKLLNDMLVFADTPIIEGAYYMRPKLDEILVEETETIIDKYGKLIDSINNVVPERLKEIIDLDILIRLGNFYYWKGLVTGIPEEYETAMEFYIRANSFKDDSILWLSIGSIFNRLSRADEAKDWIAGGFTRMRDRRESIKISRNMLFGDISQNSTK